MYIYIYIKRFTTLHLTFTISASQTEYLFLPSYIKFYFPTQGLLMTNVLAVSFKLYAQLIVHLAATQTLQAI